jgi:ubiquinone/menaquinone biosynthesis C-methylase UbiE
MAHNEDVAALYDSASMVSYETERLTKESPLEYEITLRQFQRHFINTPTIKEIIQSGAHQPCVCEIGVGVGRYSTLFAKEGLDVYLVDVSKAMLDAAAGRMEREAGVSPMGMMQSSATEIHAIPSDTFDAVVALGPMYHIQTEKERVDAMIQFLRIAKKGAPIFVAGVNRMSYLRDLFLGIAAHPKTIPDRVDFHKKYLVDGVIPKGMAPIGPAYLSTSTSFDALFASFEEKKILKRAALVGCESFVNLHHKEWSAMDDVTKRAIVDLVEMTASMQDGISLSDHFLYVGNKI